MTISQLISALSKLKDQNLDIQSLDFVDGVLIIEKSNQQGLVQMPPPSTHPENNLEPLQGSVSFVSKPAVPPKKSAPINVN